MTLKIAPLADNPESADLVESLRATPSGLTLTDLLALHAGVKRRTAQRWLAQWAAEGRVVAAGEARARRYLPGAVKPLSAQAPPLAAQQDPFLATIPLSADSHDVLAYVDQPLATRKPVGYQREFLESYQPNVTWYLPAPLRRQLHNMGHTAQANAPAGTYSRAILSRLLIDLSWASSQLEGNTYSRLDTRALIEHGQAAQGKAASETQMILNHKSAIELLVTNVANVQSVESVAGEPRTEQQGSAESAGFDRYTLMNLHAALSENLLPNPADEGRIRQHTVEIGHSVFRPLSVPQQIEDALDMLLSKARQIANPFEQAFFMLVHVPYLQPFADINKRTSRLAANVPLFRENPGISRHQTRPGRARPDAPGLPRRDQADPSCGGDSSGRRCIARDCRCGGHPGARGRPGSRAAVQSLIVDELRRLHEGVLARYGLRPSEFAAWKAQAAR